MFRSQEFASGWGDAVPIVRTGPRLVDPVRCAGDDGGPGPHSGGWPRGVDLPAGDQMGRVADRPSRTRPGRSRPVAASVAGGPADRLFRHLTRRLGSVSAAWSTDPAGAELGFQVVEFAPGRFDGAVVHSTFGLSDYVLDSPLADGHFRLELIMIAPERLRGSALPYVLGDYGRMVVALRELPEIGTIVRNVPLLAELSSMDALYLGRPPQLPLDFTRFRSGDRAVNIDWLLPVSAAEATFVDAEGWAAFEKLIFSRSDVDPIDYDRPSMPL